MPVFKTTPGPCRRARPALMQRITHGSRLSSKRSALGPHPQRGFRRGPALGRLRDGSERRRDSHRLSPQLSDNPFNVPVESPVLGAHADPLDHRREEIADRCFTLIDDVSAG